MERFCVLDLQLLAMAFWKPSERARDVQGKQVGVRS
jgi:hypothetical protein